MRRPARQTLQSARLPAPLGGQNSVTGLAEMSPADCPYAYNLIPAEKGLRARLGYQEWCTGLTGGIDSTVRTTLEYTGSRKNSSADRLFAVTASGIWDVSTSTASPTQSIAFAITGRDAGRGISCAFSTIAGRFLVYCDEENGLFIYTESTDSWAKVSGDTTQAWVSNTAYLIGDLVVNGDNVYQCDTDGTSDLSGSGPSGTGTNIADGSTRWDYVGPKQSNVIGPSLADQRAGFDCDPADFVYVTAWKNRLFFVEKDTSRAWYLDVNSIYGTATSFDFGSKMRAGGPLVGLYNWSYDGGNGLDTSLVGISGAGDVVIYQGTDPNYADTFGLKGCWSVGAIPSGRRIATDTGGDLLVLSLLGVIPLSRLVIGAEEADQSQYATAKIGPAFARLAAQYGAYKGWGMVVHPTDNALLVMVPTSDDGATEQLAMSFSTKGWFHYRELPIFSACVWNKELYFGTADGRVCRNFGYVDNVPLAADTFEAVEWSVMTAFSHLGNTRNKRVQMIRPVLVSETPNASCEAAARYDYNLLEPSAATGNGGGGPNAWDEAVWDTATWSGEFGLTQRLGGATGIGHAVAVALRGNATSRTILVAVDVMFDQGGLL